MNRSYAVAWQHAGQEVRSGGLHCGTVGLYLEGRTGEHVSYEEISELSIERTRSERVRGLPVIALALRDGRSLRIASLEGIGRLHEIASQLRLLISAGQRLSNGGLGEPGSGR
jgi:hypothetical protein